MTLKVGSSVRFQEQGLRSRRGGFNRARTSKDTVEDLRRPPSRGESLRSQIDLNKCITLKLKGPIL